MARPTGGYVEQMLDPGGWPDVDEDVFYDRAGVFTQALRQVTEVLETCQQQQAQIFDGGVWSGGAADAANGELGANTDGLMTLQNGIATVITWHGHVAGVIEQAKSTITDNLESAHQQINVLQNDASLDAAERETAVTTVVAATYGANVSVVAATAEQILASKSWKPPSNALQDLLDRKTPPPYTSPDDTTPPAPPGTPSAGTPSSGEQTPSPTQPEEETPSPAPAPVPAPAPAPIERDPQSPPAAPAASVIPPPAPGAPPAFARPPGAPASPPGSPVSPPGAAGPSSPDAPGAGPAAPLSPAASTAPPSGAGGRGKGLAPASAMSPSVGSVGREDSSPAVSPAAASGAPPGSVPPAMPGGAGAGGAAAGPSARSAGPAAQKPLKPAPTPKPAAPTRAARTAPARPEPPDRIQPPDVAAMAVVPVSAARAERDAIAAASAAEAARRQGPDPLQLARRIAAALNAPTSGADNDFGFFWVTAVTTDGAIVVANSYGLAYIPEGVQLPEPVHMATADEAIPATERAGWATHPVSAVQGWAAHHNTALRAVIATAEQFANSDSGAAKIVLKADDIPDSGVMTGRSRLEVVNPDAAERLSATADTRLTDLLPPAPVDVKPRADRPPPLDPEAQAKLEEALAGDFDPARLMELLPPPPKADDSPSAPPADRRALLWFEVVKPMTSNADGHEAAHLRAFHTYAAHAQEVALSEAYSPVDAETQRTAVANYLYWQHLTELLDNALADAP